VTASRVEQQDWKPVLVEYVNAVNEAGMRRDETLLRIVPDSAHRRRLSGRMNEELRRETALGIRSLRSEVRTRIERQSRYGDGDVTCDVALHIVRTCEMRGIAWQEERVERERIRFIRSGTTWRLDTVELLACEGRELVAEPVIEEFEGEQFERRDAMPSLPYIPYRPDRPRKSQVFAGSGVDGVPGASGHRRSVAYRREEAVAYAEKWWNEPNPAYEYFAVNCTNYVSQCLFAGQAPMNYTGRRETGWWYRGRTNGREWWSFSWAVANGLERYLSQSRSSGLRAEAVSSPDRLQLGDVICYDWEGSGRYGHTTIVTAFAPDGAPLVNANTVSSRHRYWDYRDSYAWTGRTRYRFFRIADTF
jgi:hypothetical protein